MRNSKTKPESEGDSQIDSEVAALHEKQGKKETRKGRCAEEGRVEQRFLQNGKIKREENDYLTAGRKSQRYKEDPTPPQRKTYVL